MCWYESVRLTLQVCGILIIGTGIIYDSTSCSYGKRTYVLKYCTPYWGVIFDDQAQNVTSLDDASRLRISRIGGVEMEVGMQAH